MIMGISLWQLLIILVIVLLLFGTKKLRSIGADLGGAVKGFKDSMDKKKDADVPSADSEKIVHEQDGHTIEGEVEIKEKEKSGG